MKNDASATPFPADSDPGFLHWEYPMRLLKAQDLVGREQRNGKLEESLNQKVKNLIQQLGEAIHESVSESEHIAGVVKNLREQGFDVLLMLEATIGLNEVEADDEEVVPAGQLRLGSGEPEDGPFTRNDLSFLRSLRISLPGEEEE